MSLFCVTENDKKFYETYLKDFLPEKMIDIHTHVWLDSNRTVRTRGEDRGLVTWTSLVAKDNSGDDLAETYKLMFPDKEVTPLIFSSIRVGENFDIHNDYCAECSKRLGQPALYYAAPWMDPDMLEKKILEGGFLGIKAYLDHSPAYIPSDEIRIYDFITPAQLEMLDRIGAIVMCHIPRSKRLGDPVNLAQIVEIDKKYPNLTFIVAHIGRAYCDKDFGDGFVELIGCLDACQIEGNGDHLNLGRGRYLLDYLLEWLGVVAHHHQVVAQFGQPLGIASANTRSCARNQGPGAPFFNCSALHCFLYLIFLSSRHR